MPTAASTANVSTRALSVPGGLHKAAKIAAIKQGRSLAEVTTEAMTIWLSATGDGSRRVESIAAGAAKLREVAR